MPNSLILILLSISCVFSADPEPKPLPREVKVIIDTRATEIQNAKIAYDKAILEANKKAINRMEMMVKSATQRGDLDAALANRKFIEDWNKDKDNASLGVAFGGSGPGGGKKELKDLIVGKWIMIGNNNEMSFNDKGEAIYLSYTGKWAFDGNAHFVTWSNGSTDELLVTDDEITKKNGWKCKRVN